MPARYDYDALGLRGIQELLEQEYAVVWPEVEAKLADREWETLPLPVQPHHLTNARHALLDRGVIMQITEGTRGGRGIPVIVPVDQHRRKRRVEDAAMRKRLLQARFLSWAAGSPAVSGVIGPAGEHVVHRALLSAAPAGYALMNLRDGQVKTILGDEVPGGSIDNAAVLSPIDRYAFAPTGRQYIVLVEVKNVRSWIYPSTAELHQLLDKAARLQVAHGDRRFLPVLVCRRAHYTTNQMAEHLGFYVISTKRQYVPPSLIGRELDEVRAELAYDLEPYDEAPPPALVNHFSTTLVSVADRTSDRWAMSAPGLAACFKALRPERLRPADRKVLIAELRERAERIHGGPLKW